MGIRFSRDMRYMINTLLNEFWEWLYESTNKTKEEYAKHGLCDTDVFEDDFPKIVELISLSESVVDNNELSEKAIVDLLTVMSIDNEGENVANYIIEYASEEQLKRILEMGICHPQTNARWQLTKLLYERKPKGYLEYLKVLAQDTDSYVRRRARNIISYMEFGENWDACFDELFSENHLIKKSIKKNIVTKPKCRFCQNEIGTEKLFVGYTDNKCGFWICETCYTDCKEWWKRKKS